MGMSKRAKRDISIFNRIQSSTKNQRYHTKRMTINVSPVGSQIQNAALAAMEVINASVPAVLDAKRNPFAPEQEGGSEQSISDEQKAGKEVTEGTPGGPQ